MRVVIDDYQAQPSTGTSSSGGIVTFDVSNVYEGLMNDDAPDFTWTSSDPMNGMTMAGDADVSAGVVFDWSTGGNYFYELEVAPADLKFVSGRFAVPGTDMGIDLMELATRLNGGLKLPADLPQTLNVNHTHDGVPSAFPNGCHVAEVEIDPETGVTSVVKYTAISDFGNIINPMIVAGQSHGGIAQGIGQALMEKVVYDGEGQLLTGSFMDYGLPRADDMPDMQLGDHPTPALTNPLGAKGCGEAGCAGSLTSVMNAVADALRPLGIRTIDMPATPQKVWQMIQDAKAGADAA